MLLKIVMRMQSLRPPKYNLCKTFVIRPIHRVTVM